MIRIHYLLLSVIALTILLALNTQAREQKGETVVIHAKCSGGKFYVKDADGNENCFCPQGETDILGICVSDTVTDFFDTNPWDIVCGYFGCGSGGGPPRPPHIDICVLDDGTSCADEFDACRSQFVSDLQACRANARATAESACRQNVWPNNSRYQNWHRVSDWLCPNPYDDPTSNWYWLNSNYQDRCRLVSDVQEDCVDAWLADATSGGGGGFTSPIGGITGSTGGTDDAPLAATRCNQQVLPIFESCIETVVEEKNCPKDCDTSTTERIVFNPLRPDQRELQIGSTARNALVAINKLEIEEFLNRLGYEYLNREQYEQAIEVFRVNVWNFPLSANAHDSLAQAFELSGRKALAIRSYRKALELDKNFVTSKRGLMRLGVMQD